MNGWNCCGGGDAAATITTSETGDTSTQKKIYNNKVHNYLMVRK